MSIGKTISWTLKVIDQGSRQIDKFSKQLNNVEKNSLSLKDAINLAKGAIAAFALKEVAQATFELAKLGAQSLRTEAAFEAISGGSYEAEQNLEAMRRATRGAVSDTEAMAAANRLMQMGLANNATQLENVATMAVRLGGAMGKNAGAAMEEFALLLANQSIPRLDTFGISAGRVRTRMAELATENRNLTREQRFMIAVQEEGTRAMERLGDAAEDDLLAFERLDATWTNLKTMVGQELAPAFANALGVLVEFLEWVQRNAEEGDKLIEMFGEEAVAAAELADQQAYAARMQANLANAYMGTTRAVDTQVSAYQNLVNIMRGREADAQRWTELASTYAVAADDAAEASDGLAESVLAVGEAFTQGMPDADDFYTMMIQSAWAQGKSAEELGALALAMGVADNATVQVVLAQAALQEQMDAGRISELRLIEATQALTTYNEELALAEEAAARGAEAEAQAHRDAAADAMEHFSALTMTTGALETATEVADGYVAALNRIPSTLTTHLQLTGVEHIADVVAAYGGGMAEGGFQRGLDYVPRDMLAFIHQGEMVLNPQQAAAARAMGISNDNRQFNMTVNTTAGAGAVISGFNIMRAMMQ